MSDTTSNASDGRPRNGASTAERVCCALICLAVLIGLIFVACRLLSYHLDAAGWASLLSRHGPALIGVPFGISIATCVVTAARAIDGPVEFKMVGLDMKGSAALLFAWFAIFSAIAFAVRALW